LSYEDDSDDSLDSEELSRSADTNSASQYDSGEQVTDESIYREEKYMSDVPNLDRSTNEMDGVPLKLDVIIEQGLYADKIEQAPRRHDTDWALASFSRNS